MKIDAIVELLRQRLPTLLAPSRLDPLVLWDLGPALASLAGSEVDLWELQVLRDKQELDELRAPLIEDILRSGVVHGR